LNLWDRKINAAAEVHERSIYGIVGAYLDCILSIVVLAVGVKVRRADTTAIRIRMRSDYTHACQHNTTSIPKLKSRFRWIPTRSADVQQEEFIAVITLNLVVVVRSAAKIHDEVMAVDLARAEEAVGLPLL
jgi:hypothetical protein